MFSGLIDATVLITSQDLNNDAFGVGFVILRTGETAYVVTCAQVVRKVGAESILIDRTDSGEVVAIGDNIDLDLAVVKADLLSGNAMLSSRSEETVNSTEQEVKLSGLKPLSEEDSTFLKHQLTGTLDGLTQVIASSPYRSTNYFKFLVTEDDIDDGYIGSPIVNSENGSLIGVVSQRIDERQGIAIPIDQLDRIWHPIDRSKLRRVLTDLGFRNHRLEFFKVFRKNKMSMYLIHGPTDQYAQRWMLTRLVDHFLPKRSGTAGKFRVDLCRVGKRSDVPAVWEDLAPLVSQNRKASPGDIAKATARTWLKKDIIIAIYNINVLREDALNRFIQEFWLPLANEIDATNQEACPHKLLLFLVDNEGVTATREVPMINSISTPGLASHKLDSLPLRTFSRDELENWMADKYPDLPETLIDGVESLLDASDDGVPEWTFVEICRQLGYHWQSEAQEWYVL